MKAMAVAAAFLLLALLTMGGTAGAQQAYDASTYTSMAEPTESIPVGTKITIQNWQKYQRFMSAGLQSIMSQKYFWKVPAEAVLDVGPTVKIGFPQKYREDTEKFHNQVKLVPQASGGYSVSGYVAGQPFPQLISRIAWPASN
jgi:guanyl-specific ribonuclease Sa